MHGCTRPETVGGAVRAITAPLYPDPAPGFFVYHDGGITYLPGADVEPRPLSEAGDLPTVRSVAACSGPRGRKLAALVVGGRAADSPNTPSAEPPPWVTGAELRLAWTQDRVLSLSAPALEGEASPWRVKAGRFAGEDANVLVFVYTQARFDDVVRRRPWIYRVVADNDGPPHLDPRWRGSSFSHPFRDATFCDLTGTGEGEIAALEVDRDGGRLLTAYHFEGFGVEGLAPSVKLPEVEDRLEAADWVGERQQELVVRCADGRFVFYQLDAEADELREVLSVDGPPDVLGWLVTDKHSGEPGDILCVLPDGETWATDSWQFDPRLMH
ncbi:MAG: hypothetical protein U9R79_05725 [Armatimonadota bacterium]|nr:hypothetical protein [Armatimonadota bacterium]